MFDINMLGFTMFTPTYRSARAAIFRQHCRLVVNEVNPSANGNVVGVWLRSPPAYGLEVVEEIKVSGVHVVNFLILKRLWR